MKNFYEQIIPFKNFDDFTQSQHYVELPDDWAVVITDIRGSTKAISEGRYKDVNMIGAASILKARKALNNSDFPYVFGGDGATLLVPQSEVDHVCNKLASLKKLAIDNYGLELRIGVVPRSKLDPAKYPISVAKFEITSGRYIAILKGEGLSAAEKLIKESADYEFNGKPDSDADLTGLSCRWNPIPSKNGLILTILVSSKKGQEVYANFLKELNKTLPQGLEGSNPVAVEKATYKSFFGLVREERKLHPKFSKAFVFRVLEIAFAVLVFKYKLPGIGFDSKAYANSMKTHSDYRKFDDMLRMVIDCSEAQSDQITNYLENNYKQGDLFYGTHKTDSSLMTCYVDGLGQGEHVHFIDSSNGGYALAAIGLKKQIKAKTEATV